MNNIHVHPDDWARLRRWTRSNLSFFAVGVALLIAVRYQPEMPSSPQLSASTESVADQQRGPVVAFDPSLPRSVMPEGWRRTRDGWEHVSTWTSLRSINELILQQRESEPVWAQLVFAKLRGISPLAIALMQVTAIAAIVNVARTRRDNPAETTTPLSPW